MAKFRHGFPVSTAVMVGFLSLKKKIDRERLKPLATAMIMSEEAGQDISRMAQFVNADMTLCRLFELPKEVDLLTVWKWRLEGVKIISYAAQWIGEQMEQQAPLAPYMDWNRRRRFAFQTSVLTNVFKSKLDKEKQLAKEITKKGLTT